MRPAQRLAAAGALLLAISAQAQAQPAKTVGNGPRPVMVTATEIRSFSRNEPERIRFGALEFLGGLVLESDDEDFGGISGIRMLSDDGDFLAVTDRARWIKGRIVSDGTRPVRLDSVTIAPMLDRGGQLMHAGKSFDTEALARGKDGEVYVGIERVHRVVRFDFAKHGFAARARDVNVPPGMRTLPRNQGIEGLVYVPQDRPLGGSLLAFSERGLDADENIRAFILGGQAPGEFSVRRIGDFSIVDAAPVPDGDILILERSFGILRGLGARIRLIRLADIKPGATVDGPVLIEADGGHQIDNMEGIATERGANGETIITIVSDDNFIWLQRTLLLRFALY